MIDKLRHYDLDQEPKSLWNLPFIMVLTIGFITGTANQMVNPLLSKYAVGMGASLSLAGTIVGLQTGTSMFLRPVSGAASDRMNRKLVFLGSIIVTGLAYLGYMLFNSIPMIMVCRMMQGIGFAFMSVGRTAFASGYMPKDRIGEGVGYTSFGIVLSQAVGPSFGLMISDKFGYFYCFLVAFLLCVGGGLVNLLIPYRHVQIPVKTEGKRKIIFSNWIAFSVLPYSVLAGLFAIQNNLANSFLTLIGDERGISGVGWFFTAYSLIAIFTRPMAGRMLDKKGLAVILVPAYVFSAVSMVLIGNANSLLMIILAGIFRALGQGAAHPGVQAVAIKRLGTDKAGVAAATVLLGQDFMSSIAPPIAGAAATAWGFSTMFNLSAVLMLSGIGIYYLIQAYEQKKQTTKTAIAE